jgi:hypothetical protein
VSGYLPVCNPRGVRVENSELSEYPNYGLGPPENRFYWTVYVNQISLTWFKVGGGGGQCGVDPHLRIGIPTDLECILNRWKPAHTKILFNYSGLPVLTWFRVGDGGGQCGVDPHVRIEGGSIINKEVNVDAV